MADEEINAHELEAVLLISGLLYNSSLDFFGVLQKTAGAVCIC
jgi:hypothetical protein